VVGFAPEQSEYQATPSSSPATLSTAVTVVGGIHLSGVVQVSPDAVGSLTWTYADPLRLSGYPQRW
jgi:hypothetical protein